jgi:hypothetical protein
VAFLQENVSVMEDIKQKVISEVKRSPGKLKIKTANDDGDE